MTSQKICYYLQMDLIQDIGDDLDIYSNLDKPFENIQLVNDLNKYGYNVFFRDNQYSKELNYIFEKIVINKLETDKSLNCVLN